MTPFPVIEHPDALEDVRRGLGPRGVAATMHPLVLQAALWVRLMASCGQIKVWHLGINGAMYVAYLVIVLS